jgi:hypothetical protein
MLQVPGGSAQPQGRVRGARTPWQTGVPRVSRPVGASGLGGGAAGRGGGGERHTGWCGGQTGFDTTKPPPLSWITLPGVRRRERCSMP